MNFQEENNKSNLLFFTKFKILKHIFKQSVNNSDENNSDDVNNQN